MKLKYLSFRKTFAAVQIFQPFFALFPSITGAMTNYCARKSLLERFFGSLRLLFKWSHLFPSVFHFAFKIHQGKPEQSHIGNHKSGLCMTKTFFYLHSALSSRVFTETMYPCVHLGHSNVLAWVDNSSLLLHRWQMHQKNFASFKCCRLFSVP